MANKPSHRVFFVSDAKEGGGESRWYEIGAAWPHKNKSGFNMYLLGNFRLVVLEREEPEPSEKAED